MGSDIDSKTRTSSSVDLNFFADHSLHRTAFRNDFDCGDYCIRRSGDQCSKLASKLAYFPPPPSPEQQCRWVIERNEREMEELADCRNLLNLPLRMKQPAKNNIGFNAKMMKKQIKELRAELRAEFREEMRAAEKRYDNLQAEVAKLSKQ